MVLATEAGAGGVKGCPVRVFNGQPRSTNGLSDEAVYCGEANAVHVAVFVAGTDPSATITVEGSDERGGNYLQLPDPNARQASVAASFTFEVNVGTQWVKVRIADRTGGTFTIVVTPYVSAGSRQRPESYDRNPIINIRQFESGEVDPHVSVQRWIYTVPTGKKGFLDIIKAMVERDGAAATPGAASARIVLYRNAENLGTPIYASTYSGTLGAKDSEALAGAGILNPGDYVACYTEDLSTDGTVYYHATAKITEFDA